MNLQVVKIYLDELLMESVLISMDKSTLEIIEVLKTSAVNDKGYILKVAQKLYKQYKRAFELIPTKQTSDWRKV